MDVEGGPEPKAILDRPGGLAADEDLTPGGMLLEPPGGVHAVPNGGVLKSPLGSHQPEKGGTRVKSNPEFQMERRGQVRMERLGGVADRQGSPRRPESVVGLRHRGVEPRHDGVSQELVDRPLFLEDGVGRRRQVPVQDTDEGLRIGRLADGGETADVGEQRCDLRHAPAQLQAIRIELVNHGRADHALEQTALGLQAAFLGLVVEDDRDATRRLVGRLQRGEVEAQIHRAAPVEDRVDFHPDDASLVELDLGDDRRQVGERGGSRSWSEAPSRRL